MDNMYLLLYLLGLLSTKFKAGKREHVLKQVQYKAVCMGRCSVGGHSWGSLSGGMGHELSWVGLSFQ